MQNYSFVVEKVASDDVVVVLLAGNDALLNVTRIYPDSESGLNARFKLTGLADNTHYYVAVEKNGDTVEQICDFTTGPAAQTAQNFSFGWGTCTNIAYRPPRAEDRQIADDIALEPNLRFFAQLGDIHYQDVANINPPLSGQAAIDEFHRQWKDSIEHERYEAMMRKVPMVYMYDDHDYGKNDSGRAMRLRSQSLEFYHKWAPYYGLVETGVHDAMYRRFDVGRLAFILMDQRSMADDTNAPDDANKTMIGTAQKTWLFNQMDDIKSKGMVMVMLNTRQWTIPQFKTAYQDQYNEDGPNVPVTPDAWSGFSTERKEIANAIASRGLGYQTISLTGNLHRPCFDDGTNGDFSDTGTAPIPEGLAAPMGVRPTVVNTSGYFTHGPFLPTNKTAAYSGGKVFACGMVDVADNGGNTVDLTLRLKRMSKPSEPAGLKEFFNYTWTAQIA